MQFRYAACARATRQFRPSHSVNLHMTTPSLRPDRTTRRARFGSARTASLVAIVLAATFLHAESALAKTVVVVKPGSPHCEPGVLGPTFTSIQTAINSLPIATTAVHKVIVCAGTYAEQLRITKNVTVTGVLRDGTDPESMDGNSGRARLVPPDGGLVVLDPTDTVAAQILILDADDVNITNLTIDGSPKYEGDPGVGCPTVNGTPVRIAGIAIQHAGVEGSAKRITVNRNTVYWQIGMCNNVRSYTSEGIFAENSWYTADTNSISGVDLSFVKQEGGIGKITNNFMSGGTEGIQVLNTSDTAEPGPTGTTVSGNFVTTFGTAILVKLSSHVLVNNNTVATAWNAGILVYGLGTENIVTNNKVLDAWWGIRLDSGPSGTTVRNNLIVRANKVGIVDWFGEGGNVIQNNTIQQAPYGIWTHAPLDDVINPNTFYGVTTLNGSGLNVPN